MCLDVYGKNGIFQTHQIPNPIHIIYTNTNTPGKEAEEATRSGNHRQELLKIAFSTPRNTSNRASNNCILGRKKLASTGDKPGLMQTHRYPSRNGNKTSIKNRIKKKKSIKIEFKPREIENLTFCCPQERLAPHTQQSLHPQDTLGDFLV